MVGYTSVAFDDKRMKTLCIVNPSLAKEWWIEFCSVCVIKQYLNAIGATIIKTENSN